MKVLLISRKFWALIVGLAVLLLGQFFPDFRLDEEAVIGLAIVVASYILGVAVDPGPNGGTWRGIVQSRKFWTAAVGLVLVVMDGFGLRFEYAETGDLLIWLCVTLGGYISGVALEARRQVLPAPPDVYEE